MREGRLAQDGNQSMQQMYVRREPSGVSVAVVRRSAGRGERGAGLPSWALSIIQDPTQGRARRAQVTARHEQGEMVLLGFFRLMENKSKRDK